MEATPSASPEVGMLRNYLDWLVELPWGEAGEERVEIQEAARILDEDHYGLPKVKERILEWMAVRQRVLEHHAGQPETVPEAGGKPQFTLQTPILCFVGPPGVGKTSLGRSIARALGRKLVRVSLGGIRDEAEIRGHRRTYIGALPGRVIQAMKQAGSKNAVMMLDEIDKVGLDFRGDPSAALLEVLDPEQNREFSDHYLEVPYDLSQVLFITTANVIDTISPPLRDRMEIIRMTGYTEEEKLGIAKEHLVPRQRAQHALALEEVEISDEALRLLVRNYTREAGVRGLERQIAQVMRKVPRRLVENPELTRVEVGPEQLIDYLGPAGAIPKDGPSAGVTLATVLVSVASDRPVRHDLAMTGEVTLRGRILPIGGVKDKLLAAHRAGIKTFLLPERNRRDLHEIEPSLVEGMELVFVRSLDEVLERALTPAVVRGRDRRPVGFGNQGPLLGAIPVVVGPQLPPPA